MITHARRINPATPGNYTHYTKGQPITGPDNQGTIVQHHGDPTLLALDGWLKVVPKPYNSDTHKLTDQYTDDGTEAWLEVVELSAEEKAARLSGKLSAKVTEILKAFDAAAQALVPATYTQSDINSWFIQTLEAVGVVSVGGMAARAARRCCPVEEISANAIAMAAQLAPAYCDLIEKKNMLLDELGDIDHLGDYEAGCAACDAINW